MRSVTSANHRENWNHVRSRPPLLLSGSKRIGEWASPLFCSERQKRLLLTAWLVGESGPRPKAAGIVVCAHESARKSQTQIRQAYRLIEHLTWFEDERQASSQDVASSGTARKR